MSEELDMTQNVKLGDNEVTLEQLAGLDMSALTAKRFEVLPEMAGKFEILADPAPGLRVIKSKSVKKPGAEFTVKVLDVLSVKDAGIDATTLIGKTHNEGAVFNSQDSLEYFLATLEDLGCTKGPLKVMLDSLVGVKFKAFVTHRRDKNDSDKVYAGLRKIEVYERPNASAIAGVLK